MMARVVRFNIEEAHPPIIDEIREMFPGCMKHGVLFCWGDTIFNPSGIVIPDYLIAHEAVHRGQQAGDPRSWWKKYLISPQFRFEQELPAHQAEYQQYALMQPNRNARRVMLRGIIARLSGPLYGNMVTVAKAKALIKAEDYGSRLKEDAQGS